MPKNIETMIEGLNTDSSVKEFKDVLREMKGQYEEKIETAEKSHAKALDEKQQQYEDLNLKFQEILEKAVITKDTEAQMSPDEKGGRFFQAVRKGNVTDIQKYGGMRLKGSAKDWTESKWDIGDAAEKAALGTVIRGDATTGSYLVPADYASEMFKMASQSSQMMGKVRTVPMAARDMYWPVESTKSSLTWVTDETTAKTEGAPTFGQVQLTCETCAAWFGVTDELIEDAVIDLASYTREMFAEVWGTEFDKQVLYSNASPFTSMAYNTSCNIVNMTTGKTSFDDVDFDELIRVENAISAAKGEVALQGAVWMMSRYVFNILRKLRDDEGDYIYQKPAEGQPATIWNYPYIISDQMPGSSSDAADTPFLILGNPKYWLHGNRVGMQFKIYDQTNQNMEYDQVFFRFRIRQAFVGAIPEAFGVLETAAS